MQKEAIEVKRSPQGFVIYKNGVVVKVCPTEKELEDYFGSKPVQLDRSVQDQQLGNAIRKV